MTHPSVRKADVPPLSYERGAKHHRLRRELSRTMRGVSQDNATKQNATLFHSYYLETIYTRAFGT